MLSPAAVPVAARPNSPCSFFVFQSGLSVTGLARLCYGVPCMSCYVTETLNDAVCRCCALHRDADLSSSLTQRGVKYNPPPAMFDSNLMKMKRIPLSELWADTDGMLPWKQLASGSHKHHAVLFMACLTIVGALRKLLFQVRSCCFSTFRAPDCHCCD
jgi:hypothetical protein